MNSGNDLKKIRQISKLLDSQFEFRGFRFGVDPLLGLIPGLGDFVTSLLSFYTIHLSWQMKCPPVLLFRMGVNVLLDNLIDLIPFLGNFFDFFWKANQRNLRLLEKYLENPRRTERVSYFIMVLIGVGLLACLILSLYLTFELLMAAWNFILTGHPSGGIN